MKIFSLSKLISLATFLLGTTGAVFGQTNDMFSDRIVLTGANVTTTGSNLGASKEPGEPAQGGSDGGKSVWWTWTAPVDGTLILDTTGSSFDTTLGLYTGSAVNALTQLASNDDGPSGSTSKIILAVQSGVVYQISVDGFGGGSGSITLNLELVEVPVILSSPTNVLAGVGGSATFDVSASSGSPLTYQWQVGGNNLVESTNAIGVTSHTLTLTNLAVTDANTYAVIVSNSQGSVTNSAVLTIGETATNDFFADRVLLSGTNLTTSGSNFRATLEQGEPYFGTGLILNSVWWTWTAPTNGPISIDLTGSSFNPLVFIYTGDTVTNLTQQADGRNSVIFNATVGTTYQIEVASDGAGSGSLMFSLNALQVPVVLNSPEDLSVAAGDSVAFHVTAISASPLTYQWQKNGTNLVEGGRISGVTSTSLALTNVTASDANSYSVVVRNDYSSVTNSVILTVIPVLTLTNNLATTGISGTAGEQKFFAITVVPGQKRLTVRAGGGVSGVLDLSARLGSPSTMIPWSYSNSGTNTAIVIANPTAGDYYFLLESLTDYSGVTLLADYSDALPHLENVQINNSTNLTVTLSSLYGWNSVILESSTNLLNWSSISTNPVVVATFSVTNRIAPAPQLFLRAVVK